MQIIVRNVGEIGLIFKKEKLKMKLLPNETLVVNIIIKNI